MKAGSEFEQYGPGREAKFAADLRAMLAVPPELETQLKRSKETLWMRLGSLRQVMKENDAAIEAYENVLKYNPKNSGAATQIGSILAKNKDYEKAEKCLKLAIDNDPENGVAYSYLGHCYVMNQDLQNAYKYYCQALKHLEQVNDPELWYGIGVLHDRLGSLDLALKAFLEVLEIDKNFERNDEVMFCVGIIYKEKQKYSLALEYLEGVASVEVPPPPLSKGEILFFIGHVYELQEEYQKAMDTYQRSLQVTPKNSKVLQQYAWLTHLSGKSEEALQILQGALDTAHGYYIAARIHFDRKKYQDAYHALQEAIYIDNANPFYWCTIGVLYSESMQYKDAMDAYTRAIRINPYVFEVWFNLGSLYQACDQPTDSVDAYQRALRISPSNAAVQRALENVQEAQGRTGAMHEVSAPLLPTTNPFATVLRAPQQKQQQQQHEQLQSLGLNLGVLADEARRRNNSMRGSQPMDLNRNHDRWGVNLSVTLDSRRDFR